MGEGRERINGGGFEVKTRKEGCSQNTQLFFLWSRILNPFWIGVMDPRPHTF
jgi:hypothetical protein